MNEVINPRTYDPNDPPRFSEWVHVQGLYPGGPKPGPQPGKPPLILGRPIFWRWAWPFSQPPRRYLYVAIITVLMAAIIWRVVPTADAFIATIRQYREKPDPDSTDRNNPSLAHGNLRVQPTNRQKPAHGPQLIAKKDAVLLVDEWKKLLGQNGVRMKQMPGTWEAGMAAGQNQRDVLLLRFKAYRSEAVKEKFGCRLYWLDGDENSHRLAVNFKQRAGDTCKLVPSQGENLRQVFLRSKTNPWLAALGMEMSFPPSWTPRTAKDDLQAMTEAATSITCFRTSNREPEIRVFLAEYNVPKGASKGKRGGRK